MISWLPSVATESRGAYPGDSTMKKIAFGILIALIAASPAVAAKKKKAPAAEPTVFERNEAGFRFVRDSLPIYYPTVMKAVVYSGHNQQKK
jgi:hypothetical protein